MLLPASLKTESKVLLSVLLLPYLSASLLPNPNQHGFRPARSTVSALLNSIEQ